LVATPGIDGSTKGSVVVLGPIAWARAVDEKAAPRATAKDRKRSELTICLNHFRMRGQAADVEASGYFLCLARFSFIAV
jgi:hypothetical protein